MNGMRQLYKDAIARNQDPAEVVESMMVGRGWQRRSVREYHAEQRRQAEARQRAAEQREQDAIDERMAKLSRRLQYMSFSEFSREDRKFYREHCRNGNLLQQCM
jgi:hypothetical protein